MAKIGFNINKSCDDTHMTKKLILARAILSFYFAYSTENQHEALYLIVVSRPVLLWSSKLI